MKLHKTSRIGVYTRTTDTTSVISFIITYKINSKLYKKKLGTNLEGWNINKASKERAKRISSDKIPITKELEKQTLDQLANDYLISISHKSDYRNTLGRYTNHIKPILGDREIRSITVSIIQSFKLQLSKIVSNKTGKTLSAKSINDRLNLINTIYNYYNKINYSNQIPSPANHKLVERYFCDNSRLRFLTKQEYSLLLESIENRVDYTKHKNVLKYRTQEMLLFTKLLITTGMRTYSALTLRAKDFDFESNTMQVKNHKSNRVYNCFIHQSIKEEIISICKNLHPEHYIFGKNDKPLHRTTINKRLQPILNRLFNRGVTDNRERVVVHTLRHTFGSWLAQQGTSLYIICKLMDHKDISQTQVYSKLTSDSGKKFVENILG